MRVCFWLFPEPDKRRVVLTCRRTGLNVFFNSLEKMCVVSHMPDWTSLLGGNKAFKLWKVLDLLGKAFFIFCVIFSPPYDLRIKEIFLTFFFILQSKLGQIPIFKNVIIFVRVPCNLQLSKLYYSPVIWVLRKKFKSEDFVLAF